MLDNIYFYVIPAFLFLAFGYIIVLLIIKQHEFTIIEQNFDKKINTILQTTEERIDAFVKELTRKTEQTLRQFTDANEKQLNSTITQLKNLNDEIEVTKKNQQELNKINLDLSQNIEHLNNKIKKRDAIIDRKTKQIKRLKNGI